MPKQHMLFGIGISIVLLLSGVPSTMVILILLTSVLIDIDHFFYYAIKFKCCDIHKMYNYFLEEVDRRKSTIMLPVMIFHNMETLILLSLATLLISSASYILLCVTIGITIHLLLDWWVMPTKSDPSIIKISLIGTVLENSRRKRGCPRW